MNESSTLSLTEIKEQLRTLNPDQAAAYCASCAERLLPSYAHFARKVRWGDSETLDKILNEIWSDIAHRKLDQLSLTEKMLVVDRLLPHTEDFRFPFTLQAGHAALAVYLTLECLIKRDVGVALHVFDLTMDSVDHYLLTKAELEGKPGDRSTLVDVHPLWNEELEKQKTIVRLLGQAPRLSDEFLQTIRKISSNKGKSNVGLS